MAESTKLKVKGDYSEHMFTKTVDGEQIKVVAIDEMSADQWQKYCRDTGTEPFHRLSVGLKS